MVYKDTYIDDPEKVQEMEFYQTLLDRLFKKKQELRPQVLLIDGPGVWHPKRSGQACMVGMSFDLPTIGVTNKASNIGTMNQAYYKKAISEAADSGDLSTQG